MKEQAAVVLLPVLTVLGCGGRPPFLVLTVEDPERRAAGFATIAAGLEPSALVSVTPEVSALPLSLTLTAPTAGDKLVWVEARDAAAVTLGRGRVVGRFTTHGTSMATVILAPPCERNQDCDDGFHCDGVELCIERTCVRGEQVCGASFPCVTSATCNETTSAAACDFTVDHRLCGEGEYCDPSLGCVAGQGCNGDEGCDDDIACNGYERCVRGRCESGVAPCTSPLACVQQTCIEAAPSGYECSFSADHAQCPDGAYCNLAVGCVQGRGCHDDADCDDHLFCNGDERCVNLVCVAGSAPSLTDDDICTLDGCDDARAASGESPVFRFAVPGLDGSSCTIPGGGDGVCVAAQGGCVESSCGDGVRAANEECDDGNADATDGCLADCTLAFCGDGVVRAALEECDTAGESATCNEDCTLAVCGDRTLNPSAGEECDTGGESAVCTATCRFSRCGDALANTVAGEVCDDGNTASGDGCRGDCAKVEQCGDAIVDAGEACDDANHNPNDGCDRCARPRWSTQVLVGLGEGQGQPAGVAVAGPQGLAFDRHGNLFVADNNGHRIWRVDAATDVITIAAGRGVSGFSGDGGAAQDARLNYPSDVAIDGADNLLIADRVNNRIRFVCGDPATCAVGTISTIAGTGAYGYAGDGGPATSAAFDYPAAIALDGLGNLLIADGRNHRVRRVDASTGIITTVAGSGVEGSAGDGGPATDAELALPWDVALDSSGRILIVEMYGARVRRVDPTTGLITTVAGGGWGYGGDGGRATAALLYFPTAVTVDGADHLLIADSWNDRVRRVDATTGIITTVAGSGAPGFAGDGGLATVARLYRPAGLAVAGSGALYVADTANNRVRRVANVAGGYVGGNIATIVGTGSVGFAGEGGPATSAVVNSCLGVAADPTGNVFYVENGGHRVRMVCGDPAACAPGSVTTIAGTGTGGFGGDGGPATGALLSQPHGIAVDHEGNLVVADQGNHRVRRIDRTTGIITTVAGNGDQGFFGDGGAAASARLNSPSGVAAGPGGALFIMDRGNQRVRRVDDTSGVITTVAGSGADGFAGDGAVATAAAFSSPYGLAVDGAGNVFIADYGNSRIRRVDHATQVITTVAGTGVAGFSGDDGSAGVAQLNLPWGVAADAAGNLFVADAYNRRVRRIDGVTGIITTVAGHASGGFSGDGGPATNADLNGPLGIAVDGSGNLLLATSDRVRRVCGDAASCAVGTITTIAGAVDPEGNGPFPLSRLGAPRASVALGSSWLVADGASGRVRSLSFDDATVATVAGYPVGFTADGVAARYSRLLLDPRGIAFDAVGSRVFVSEYGGHTIRAISVAGAPSTWTVSTWAGALSLSGHVNGGLTVSRFANPAGLLFDAVDRRLYVADSGNHVLRAIAVDSGTVSTVAGTPRAPGYFGEHVPATSALFDSPQALTFGNDGSLYVADTGNNRVRRIAPNGIIDTVLGNGTPASSGEGLPAHHFPVNRPLGLVVDSFGNLFVSSATAIRLIAAGDDGLATGDDPVLTIYGRPPRDSFPVSVTNCLAGLTVRDGNTGSVDGRLLVLDACQGFLLQLDRGTP